MVPVQNSADGLFNDGPRITEWLPDETLFSLCSRFHWISGNRRPDQTCGMLFGHSRQGSSHDFPCRTDEFVRRTAGALGAAEQIIRQRTILPYYFPLRSERESANAIAAVRSGGLGGIKARLGMLASRFGAAHPLKACVACIREDIARDHLGYWRRAHQWPGVFVCQRHETSLMFALGKVNAHGRFHWFLPSELELVPFLESRDSGPEMDVLLRLAQCSAALGNLPPGVHLRPHDLAAAYQARLRVLDLARPSGSIKTAEFQSYLAAKLGPLSVIRGLESVGGDLTTLAEQFARLVRRPRTSSHPLRHMLLTATLFSSWNEFTALCDRINSKASEPTVNEATSPAAPVATGKVQVHAAVLKAVADGQSATAAAKASGVSVVTAMAWIAATGSEVGIRPKALTEDVRALAVARLKRGTAKEPVAVATGVSVQSITRLLRTVPGLQVAWHQARFDRRQKVAREAWARTAGRLREPTASTLRQLQPAVFAWLYRNDRAWLLAFAERLSVAPRSNHSGVPWDHRDRGLSDEIKRIALDLSQAAAGRRIRLSQLCDAIPQLKRRLSDLDRLPLTRAAIASAVRRVAAK